MAKSAKGTPSVLTLNALQGILGTPSLNTTSVTITSAPNGSQGEAVTATSSGSISFTAPTNKTGTYVITFTYTAYGVTVAGSTITVTVT
ncbi:MAG: hypothetical protein ACKOE2_04015 [Actinomycetales bacterium]